MSAVDLKPRAVAVLVALRSGPRTTAQLRLAIGDGRKSDPKGLLAAMRSTPLSLVTQRPNDDRWYLTDNGIGWLQSNGLDAEQRARLSSADEQVAS